MSYDFSPITLKSVEPRTMAQPSGPPVMAPESALAIGALPEHHILKSYGWLNSRDEPELFHKEVEQRLVKGEKPTEDMLQQAILYGRRDTVALLLANGADPDAAIRNCTGRNLSDTVEVLDILLMFKADVFGANKDGYTLIEIAHHAGDLPCRLKLLGSKDTDGKSFLAWKDFAGNTALHRACMLGKVNAVRLLLESGASIHKVNAKYVPPVVPAFDLPKEMLHAVLREIAVERSAGAQSILAWAVHLDRQDIQAWVFAEKLVCPSMVMHYRRLPAEFLKNLDGIFTEAVSRGDWNSVENCVDVLCNVIAWREGPWANQARRMLASWEELAGDRVVEAYAHKRSSIHGRHQLQPFDDEIKIVSEYRREQPIEVGEITFRPYY